jgi:hypothetical protein
MKTYLMCLLVFVCTNCDAQKTDENIIRQLEEAERLAILKHDTTRLADLMSRLIVVQNPENRIVRYQDIIDRIREGKINYSSFKRKIENITFANNIAVVMGLETIVAESTGVPVTRRFTNIWTKEKKSWKLTARQATKVATGNAEE